MGPLLIIDELRAEAASASGRELTRSIEAARIAGFRTFSVPVELPRGIEVADVLSNLPTVRDGTPVLFAGYIPLRDRYESLAAVLGEKGYRVLVSPSAHRQMLEVDASAKALGALTTPLAIIDAVSRAVEITRALGFPLFLKGAVQSLKHEGVDACVARDEASLERIVGALLQRTWHSRGRVVARPLLKLRHVRNAPNGFPAGREYRAVVFRGEVLGLAPYWDGVDSLTALTRDESDQVHALATDAASRFESPLVGVDIGQDEDRRWWIIETNDPQFMGLSQLEPLKLWHRLWSALHTRTY